MLAASEELELSIGGKPAELLDAGNKRRTVYSLVDRQFLAGAFRTFDFANPDIHVAVRHETTVPQQAPFFLNAAFAADRAKALARRFAGATPSERIQQLHRAIYQRAASRSEVAGALAFIKAAAADPPPVAPPVPETQWRYGTGAYDETNKQVKVFKPLHTSPVQPGKGLHHGPEAKPVGHRLPLTGAIRVIHPQACIRRWIAPRDASISIAGTLKHEPEQGDGVRGFIVSSRQGELKATTVHHSKAEMAMTNIVVKAGETLDFVVDIGGTLNADQFLWAPVIKTDGARWDAKAEFNGPVPPLPLLTAWEQYAQVLLLANEFAFVD